MLILQTKTKEEIRLPENCDEIKLSQFIDYDVHRKHWVKAVETHGFFSLEAFQKMLVFLNKWFEDDETDLSSLEVDFNKNNTLSVFHIVKHIDKIVESLQPKNVSLDNVWFTYKDEIFYFSGTEAFNFLDATYNRPLLTMGEVVEIMEYKRLIDIEISKEETPLDTQENHIYTEALRSVAILAKKKGEVLPSVQTEKWIVDRIKFFKDISLQAYSDISFFLTIIGLPLKPTPNFITSSIHRNELLKQKSNLN